MKDRTSVLCNSGPLIALGKLNRLDLLAKVYEKVTIPRAVYDEVVVRGLARGSTDARAVKLFWRQKEWPIEDPSESILKRFQTSVVLGAGETQVLALAAATTEPVLVLLDDELARNEARRLNFIVKGTLGILIQAHRKGHLPFGELELLVKEIDAHPGIWISSKLCHDVLEAVRGPSA